MDTTIVQISLAVAAPVAVIAAIVWHRNKIRSVIDVTEDIDWSGFEADFGDAYFKHPAWRNHNLTPEGFEEIDKMYEIPPTFSPLHGVIETEEKK